MSNLQQAPTLMAQGAKNRGNGGYWSYNTDFISYLMNNTTQNQLKLMLYLCGNTTGWHCSTQNIIDRTGLPSKQVISKVKKELAAKGWITYSEAENITVQYDNIYQQMKGNQNVYPVVEKAVVEEVQGNQNDDPSLQGKQNDDPRVNNLITLEGKQNDYHNNINNNIKEIVKGGSAGKPASPPLDFAALEARAKAIYVEDPRIKNHRYKQPFPGRNLFEIDGEYYYITNDYKEVDVEIA